MILVVEYYDGSLLSLHSVTPTSLFPLKGGTWRKCYRTRWFICFVSISSRLQRAARAWSPFRGVLCFQPSDPVGVAGWVVQRWN